MPEDTNQFDEWGSAYDKIQERIKALGIHNMNYSAYDLDRVKDLPVDNLDKTAFEGTYRIKYKLHWGTGGVVISEEMTNPTWLEVAKFASYAIEKSGDKHHIFFESLSKIKDKDETYYEMFCGS